MRKYGLPLLLALALLLSGCGGDRAARARYEEVSRRLRKAEVICAEAKLRCEYEDRSVEFRLRCKADDDAVELEVLEPELIAGIRASVESGGTRMEYEGMILDLGPLDPYGLSPLGALPLLLDTLRSGHLDSHWEEDGAPVWQLTRDDHTGVTVWMSPDFKPLRAEILSDDQVRVFLELTDWSEQAKEE